MATIVRSLLVLMLALTFASCTDHVEITAQDKYVKRNYSHSDSFFVASREGEVFQNSDSIFFLKFNSADLQQQIKLGKTYTAEVHWYRVPILSMYRNIISIKEKDPNQTND